MASNMGVDPHCFAPGCHTIPKKEGVALFNLPTCPVRRNIWAKMIGINLDNFSNPESVRVCGKHFEDWCFTNSSKRRLSRYAMPISRTPSEAQLFLQKPSTTSDIHRKSEFNQAIPLTPALKILPASHSFVQCNTSGRSLMKLQDFSIATHPTVNTEFTEQRAHHSSTITKIGEHLYMQIEPIDNEDVSSDSELNTDTKPKDIIIWDKYSPDAERCSTVQNEVNVSTKTDDNVIIWGTRYQSILKNQQSRKTANLKTQLYDTQTSDATQYIVVALSSPPSPFDVDPGAGGSQSECTGGYILPVDSETEVLVESTVESHG